MDVTVQRELHVRLPRDNAQHLSRVAHVVTWAARKPPARPIGCDEQLVHGEHNLLANVRCTLKLLLHPSELFLTDVSVAHVAVKPVLRI